MAEKLVIRKFGPIDEMSLDIKKTVVFIGPQSSGKSTVAKLLAIFRSIDVIIDEKEFLGCFQEYMISNYFNGEETYLEYSNPDYKIIYEKEKWVTEKNPVFTEKISNEKKRIEKLIRALVEDRYKDDTEEQRLASMKQIYDYNWKTLFILLKKQIYIPAERILTSVISESAFSFNEIALPGSLKQFGKHFETSRIRLKELKIDSLNITYKYVEDGATKGFRIYYDESHSISLAESSSGVQALVPIQLVVENLSRLEHGYSFIVEEPELNLFPTAQKSILSFLVKKCNHKNELVMTTHSPYILSVLNNLLFAYTVSQKSGIDKRNVHEIIPEDIWIDPSQFNAYYLDKGVARCIFNSETKLIADNELDGISTDISGERDALIELILGVHEK